MAEERSGRLEVHVVTPEQEVWTGEADMLIATAIELACPLVSYDERIVRFGKRHGRQYGFAMDVT